MVSFLKTSRNLLLFAMLICFNIVAAPPQTAQSLFIVNGTLLDESGLSGPISAIYFIDSTNSVLQTSSSATSKFSISVPSGSYKIRIDAPGFPIQYYNLTGNTDMPIFRIPINSDMALKVTLSQLPKKMYPDYGIVSGIILDSLGRPLPFANVGLFMVSTKDASATVYADSTGRFSVSVPAVLHVLVASYGMYPKQYWSPQGTSYSPLATSAFQVIPNDTTRIAMKLSTRPGVIDTIPYYSPPKMNGSISGKVIDITSNQSTRGLLVVALPKDSAMPNAMPLVDRWNVPYSDTVDATGSYTIKNLPFRDYWVYVKGGQYITQFYPKVDFPKNCIPIHVDSIGKSNIDFGVRVGGTISGKLVSNTNDILDSLEVYANQFTTNLRQYALTNKDGTFSINGLPAGDWNLSVNARSYLVDMTTLNKPITITETSTITGVSIPLSKGGFISGTFSPAAMADSMWQGEFEIAMFPESLYTSITSSTKGTVLFYEKFTTSAMTQTPTTFISSIFAPGTYRLLYRPFSPYVKPGQKAVFEKTRSYSTGANTFLPLSQVPPITIRGGDTIKNIQVNFGNGFTIPGSFHFDNTSAMMWAHVDAYVKDNGMLYPVSHGYVNSGDSQFVLTGLAENTNYFLRVEAQGYPPQYFSPGGTMTQDPAQPFTFSLATASTQQLSITPSKTMGGTLKNAIPLSCYTTTDQFGNRSVSVSIDASLAIDSLMLFTTDATGLVSRIANFPLATNIQQYSWPIGRDYKNNSFSYIAVAYGKNFVLRSNSTGNSMLYQDSIASDSLSCNIIGDRYGISIAWNAGKTYTGNDIDSVYLYRLSTSGVWSIISRQWSRNTRLSDNTFDKVKDAGTTLSYKVELVKNGNAVKKSSVQTFTVTTAFVNNLAKRLLVGSAEQYKTIQSAIDAAGTNDIISVFTGTYKENLDFKGKSISLDGQWKNGLPPIVDGSGQIAIKIPFVQANQNDAIRISGFKIQNSLIGISTSTNVQVDKCLFVNIMKQALYVSFDTTSMVIAAQKNPFIPYAINIHAWQCTFVGNGFSGGIAHIISQGSFENGSTPAAFIGLEQQLVTPPSLFSSNAGFDNCIITQYSMPNVPIEMVGKSSFANFNNCNFWNASTGWQVIVNQPLQVNLDSSTFKINPIFSDSVNYIPSPQSPMRTLARNGSTIGFDGQNQQSGGGSTEPKIAAVKNIKTSITGSHAIQISWDRLAIDQKATSYVIFRVHGFDTLFSKDINSNQWQLQVANDSMLTVLDTFSTIDTSYIDTTPKIGFPYFYVVAGRSSSGEIGTIDLPASRPLSSFRITIPALLYVKNIRKKIINFTTAILSWSQNGKNAAYKIYKIALNSTETGTSLDSNSVRAILKNHVLTPQDTLTISDTTFTDSTLVFNTPYLFALSVVNKSTNGFSLDQTPLTAITLQIAPDQFTKEKTVAIIHDRWYMVGPWGKNFLTFSNAAKNVLYHWDDTKQPDKLYSNYTPGLEMKAGSGYWYKTDTDTQLTIDTVNVINTLVKEGVQTTSIVKGQTGWNQIATVLPYPVSPSWLSTIPAYEWIPDSNKYVFATVLEPWKAYWIWTNKDTLLPLTGKPLPRTGLTKKAADVEWELKVSLLGKNSNDPDNYCGIVKQRLAKSLLAISPKPPQAFEYPQLFFVPQKSDLSVQPQIPSKRARIYICETQSQKKYEWTIGITPANEAMTVSINGIQDIPDKVGAYFIQNGIVYDLRKTTAIPVSSHKETVYGYIVVTSDARDLALYSGNFDLKKAYPNPFIRTATIEFTVPYNFGNNGAKVDGEFRNVNLKVYSVSGRLVATLIHGTVPVGYHKTVWQGQNDYGSNVSSGYYIVRLSGIKFQKTVTIFKIR